MSSSDMKIKALAPWFGANRKLAATVGKRLGRCDWVGVPFAGGCSELPHISCRAGVANDLHRHIVNLARVVADPSRHDMLWALLQHTLFHPDELALAQRRCLEREIDKGVGGLFAGERVVPDDAPDVRWAADYFVCAWMSRSALAGTGGEFAGGTSVRWTSSGGDSNTRYRSAVDSLRAWHRALCEKWNFTTLDCFDFLGSVKDQAGHAVYADAPWPDGGEQYKHRFTDEDQARLARKLATFEKVRVVIRYGDHPLIRKLYPRERWTWIEQESRNQEGNLINEVLILNGPDFTTEAGA